MLALVLICLASPGRFDRVNSRTPDGRSDRGLLRARHAMLEFAPPDGAGMGAACACAAVTGANGEALSMTRASTATCSRQGAATTDISPGDLVTCASNLPRIEAVNGGLGYLREGAATNVDPRSAELDDASYGDLTANGAAAPVLNGADAALSPDGALTAEDYTFAATGATQASARAISVLTAAAYSAQVWIRGVSGSGSMDLCLQTSGTPTATCSTCTFVSTSWTQCKVENVTAVAGGQVSVGNLSYFNGGISRASNRVYVWGLDAEAGAFATSYIPTSGATASRSADSALTGYASTTWGPDFSLSASVAFVDTSASSTTVAQLGSAAPNLAAAKTTNNTTAAYTIASTSTGPTVAAMGSAQHRTALSDATGSRGAWWDTLSVAAPAASITSWFDGAIDTAVTYVTGKTGQAGSFDGSASKIQTAIDGPLGNAPRSVSCWFFRNSGNSAIVRYGVNANTNFFQIGVTASNRFRVYTGAVDIIDTAITAGAWHHAVVTYDGTTTSAYIDGAAPITSAATINTLSGNAVLGHGPTYGYMIGLIDSVAIWGRELASGEVTTLYNSGAGLEAMSGSLLTGLLHSWRLDGNSFDDYSKASLTIGALNARTSSVCADPNSARCR